MPTALGSLRRLALTPAMTDVSFSTRGFPVTESARTRKLEAVPQAVVSGFDSAIDAASQWEVERKLALIEPEYRGFAYEGATMACCVLDALGGRRHRHTERLMRGPARRHLFLTYIGVGFAMARLPRPLWKNVLPDLDGVRYHPVMSWLAVDGYGFDRAYFDTARWVDRQEVPAPYPWQGDPGYFPRAVDQGIGRALWFVHGGRPRAVGAAVRRFAAGRHADLFSGAGLAAVFAGGCPPGELRLLADEAGEHAPDVAQGAVFAVKARDYAGFAPPHTEGALTALTGLGTSSALRLADDTEPGPGGADPAPAYERWRRAIRARFAPRAERVT